jgi:diguanylate cyclase (GGDEF)-like protein
VDTTLAVLVVEDSPEIGEVVTLALEGEGHRARLAEHGRDACAALDESWPDVLLLDRMLPDMDGLELCAYVRTQRAAMPYLPIVMLTALGATEQKMRAFDRGADDYITKPFELSELVARVRVWGRAGRRIRELHELRGLYEESQRVALLDALTGLYNRRALEDMLESEIDKARRLKYPVGVLVIDVDHFKAINDRLGHLEGDQVLVAAARALRQALRKSDLLARFGGDEFVALLPGCPPGALGPVGEQLRSAVSEIYLDALNGATVTVTIGGASSGDDRIDAKVLLSRADEALYRAKVAGRNRVAVADDGVVRLLGPGLREAAVAGSNGATTVERRSDPLLRDVVNRCQPHLEASGFRLAGRGSADDRSWVEFHRPERDPAGEDGSLVLMMGHERRKQALMVDAYFVDPALDHTPRHKLLCRYQGEELPSAVHHLVDKVRSWTN